MSSDQATPGTVEVAQDSARVKRYHRTGRILAVAGYLIDLGLLVVLLFAGWSAVLRDFRPA